MGADLDAALEPGETVVFRTCGRSHAAALTYYGVMLTAIVLFSWLSVSLGSPGFVDWGRVATIAVIAGGGIAGLVVVLLISKSWQRRDPDDLAVTDRRLLFANGDWDDKLESLRLDQIERVAWLAAEYGIRHLTVFAPERTIRLPYLREADAAGHAIARAAGVSAPPPLGRLGTIETTHFGMVPVVFAAYLGLMGLSSLFDLFEPGGLLGLDVWWLDPAAVIATMSVAVLLGAPIGIALTLAFMRAVIPAEKAQAVLCAGKPDRWYLRLVLRWASRLYGRPISYVAC